MVGAGIDAGTVVEGAGMRWERRVASAVNGTAQFRASITLEITDFDWQCLIIHLPSIDHRNRKRNRLLVY